MGSIEPSQWNQFVDALVTQFNEKNNFDLGNFKDFHPDDEEDEFSMYKEYLKRQA